MLIFDSQNEKYRSPFGAVRTGETVRFAPRVTRKDITVTLRLWVDGHEELIQGRRSGSRVIFEYTPQHAGLVWYFFLVDTPEGRLYYSAPRGGMGRLYEYQPDSFQLTVYDDNQAPEWFTRGIAYQIFPDRFYRPGEIQGLREHKRLGHALLPQPDWGAEPLYRPIEGELYYRPADVYGGSLYGVMEKLPYLKSLGVSCIYLNPIMLSSSNHRYNVADYMKVDPVLGGDRALAALAKAAKKQGIRLMLDGVFSHTGDDSKYFDRYSRYGGGAYSDPASPYREWYEFYDYPNTYRSWWGFTTLPEVRELTPSYMEFIGSVLEHYAKLGVTSWRLDVADELPDEFIAFIKQRLRELDPSSVLLGEVWEDASNKTGFGERRRYVDGHELDSTMCYPFRSAVMDFFTGSADAHELRARLLSVQENYPEPFYMAQLNLLGSHDTIRALTAIGGAPHQDSLTREQQRDFRLPPARMAAARERLMSAAALQFTMPGVPCIYYGDEAGLTGMADPFNRTTFPWGAEDEELTAHYRALARIRNESAALQTEPAAFAAPNANVFALCRGDVVCAINRSASRKKVTLRPKQFAGRALIAAFEGSYTEALTGSAVTAGGTLEFTLPPHGRAIFIKG